MMTLLQGHGQLNPRGLTGSTDDSDHYLPIHDDRAMVLCLWYCIRLEREGHWGLPNASRHEVE